MMKKLSGTKRPITLRRVLTTAAILLLFALVFVAPAAAADEKTYTLKGEGTEASPFLIETVNDLKTMRDAINTPFSYSGTLDPDDPESVAMWQAAYVAWEGESITPQEGGTKQVAARAHYKLVNDIDLNNEEWTPIAIFKGTLDGNNKKIQNLKITDAQNLVIPSLDQYIPDISLNPGFISGTYNENPNPNPASIVIKNLIIENAEIVTPTAEFSVGVLIADIESDSDTKTTITNCDLTGTIKITSSNNENVGTLIGLAGAGTVISGCDITGTLTIEASGRYPVGGLTGTSGAAISDCTINVDAGSSVKGTNSDSSTVGGLVGNHNGGSITGCTVNTPVSGTSTVGGLIGKINSQESDAVIEGCEATGSVTLDAGGEVDYAAVGGLVGEISKSATGDYVEIKDCTSSGTISVAEGVETPVNAGFVGSATTQGSKTQNSEEDIAKLNEKIADDCTFIVDEETKETLSNEKVNTGTAGVASPQYTITFHANDGTSETKTQTVKQGVTNLEENTFTREGYTFLGWNETATGTEIAYEDAAAITGTEPANLYALWKLIPPEPFTVSTDKDMITVGKTATLTASASEAQGVTYLYQWYSVTDNVALDGQTGKTITVTPAKRTEYNCTITAKQGDDLSETVESTNTVTIDVWKQDSTISADEEEAFEEAIEGEFKELFEEVDGLILVNITLLNANGEPDHTKVIKFTVDYLSATTGITADNYDQYEFVVLHYNALTLKVERVPNANVTPGANGLEIESAVSPFVIGYSKQTSGGGGGNGGSSTPQGSSVWLQEPLTPTPTETAQPTPTDVAPTDIPTTQPTETPKTPGFGVLSVLAGLGAVAVLRRK